MRRLCVIAMAAAAVLAGCGEEASTSSPPGSPDNPLVGKPVDDSGTERLNETVRPEYGRLVESQSSRPRSRFTPCGLVTESQARRIVGAPIEAPVEAAQGPTCIYRSRNGDSMVTVAVQQGHFGALTRQLRGREEVDVSSRRALCGTQGQPMLYLPFGSGRVLAVGGECDVAKRFAARALTQLSR